MRRLIFAFAFCLATVAEAATPAPEPADARALAAAMGELRRGDWSDALAAARPGGRIARDVIDWHRLRAGRGSFDDARDFLTRNPDWPGLPLLRERMEATVPVGARAEAVIDFFAQAPPQTGGGSLALTSAFEAAGRRGDADAQAALAWLTQSFSPGHETSLLARYAELLRPHHHRRLDMTLWNGWTNSAGRMMSRVSDAWAALARARMALAADRPGVDALIEAVPAALADDAGLAFERFEWRARRGRNDDAIAMLRARSKSVESLGRPDAWAGWRRIFARKRMRAGDPEEAYALASRHFLSEGSDYADLEWLSGYLALTYLDDPERARDHFRRFRVAVFSPISLGRAGYWEGRAEEALGNSEAARAAYAFGAEHQTSFYGLLAAERAGLPMDPALTGAESFPDWRGAAFTDSSVFRAALLLHEAGERSLAERFLVHLCESLDATAMGQLADMALDDWEAPHVALKIAKYAARQGVVLHRAYYPVADLGLDDLPVPPELALSIARRESEFDPAVRSGAGAMGLMQLMPGTAREMARDQGLAYSARRLLDDPGYNARLGTAYLDELIGRFGNNYVLVAAGYNAGPSRSRRWSAERGDPRSGEIDVVDWIEHIPFRETQNYVMRVMESLPVYRARLSGETGAIALSEELEAR